MYCMYSPPYKCRTLVPCMRRTFYVVGHSAQYVEQWSHLGHIVSADRDDKHVILLTGIVYCVVKLTMFCVILVNVSLLLNKNVVAIVFGKQFGIKYVTFDQK